jgi:hypothetical protein
MSTASQRGKNPATRIMCAVFSQLAQVPVRTSRSKASSWVSSTNPHYGRPDSASGHCKTPNYASTGLSESSQVERPNLVRIQLVKGGNGTDFFLLLGGHLSDFFIQTEEDRVVRCGPDNPHWKARQLVIFADLIDKNMYVSHAKTRKENGKKKIQTNSSPSYDRNHLSTDLKTHTEKL